MKKLVSANIVVVAQNLNPSIFTVLWLVEEGIIQREDVTGKHIFTQVGTSIPTPNFKLDVLPERLQIAFTDISLENPESVIDAVWKIICKLPHTPYTAIGTNISWMVAPDDQDEFSEFMRNLFVKPELPLYKRFTEDNARFGGYLSKDFLGTRMKVDIKPRSEKDAEKATESLFFTFNYHLGLEHGKHMESVKEFLDNWNAMRNESKSIISSAFSDSA